MTTGSPKEGEAAQALFCAVVDYEGKKIDSDKVSNYDEFKKVYKNAISRVKNKVIHRGITESNIAKLLNKHQNGWYDSSVNIANQLFDDVKKISKITHQRIKPKGISLYYVRDDDKVMGSISTIFTHVNDMVKERNRAEKINDLTFNNLNKWTPADIYLASARGRMVLNKLASGKSFSPPIKIGKTSINSLSSLMSFGVFNAIMKQLMKKGDLLPLSLKKAPKKGEVIIKTINFKTGDVAKALEKNDVRYHGYIFAQTQDIFNSKDVYLKITDKHKLQFRDKGGTGGGIKPVHSYQCIITGGKAALDGSLGGGSIGDVIYQTSPQLGRHFSLSSQRNIIAASNRISEEMREEMEHRGELKSSISNEICNKVYKYSKDFTDLKFGTQEEFYMRLYNHDNYGLSGTGVYTGKEPNKVRVENEILRKRARAQFLFGKYMGGRLIEGLLKMTEVKRNETTLNFMLYAGSRTSKASPHVKASDTSSF